MFVGLDQNVTFNKDEELHKKYAVQVGDVQVRNVEAVESKKRTIEEVSKPVERKANPFAKANQIRKTEPVPQNSEKMEVDNTAATPQKTIEPLQKSASV